MNEGIIFMGLVTLQGNPEPTNKGLSRLGVWGLGFGVWGLGVGVWGFGFRAEGWDLTAPKGRWILSLGLRGKNKFGGFGALVFKAISPKP